MKADESFRPDKSEFELFKAETHDATNRCDMLPRQVVATNRLT